MIPDTIGCYQIGYRQCAKQRDQFVRRNIKICKLSLFNDYRKTSRWLSLAI